jgi:uncharacterized protein YjiS (DUF1127 family)
MVVLNIVDRCYNITINTLTMENTMWDRIKAWSNAYVDYKSKMLVEAELRRLTDRELRDMGIGRSEIKGLVWYQ